MFFSKVLAFRTAVLRSSNVPRPYSSDIPARIDFIPVPVSPHSSYILSRRGFAPVLKHGLYDETKHPSIEKLRFFEENPLIKSGSTHLPRPFEKMDYESAKRYVEWSYPYTGLGIMDHINNVNELVDDKSYPATIRLLVIYRDRYNIESKTKYEKFDLMRLIKPYRKTMKAIKNKKKRVFTAFVIRNKKELILELQNRKKTAEDPKKIHFSQICSEYFKICSPEELKKCQDAVDADWERLNRVFQYDTMKEAWQSRKSYSVVSSTEARKQLEEEYDKRS